MSTKKDETRLRLLDAARKLLIKRGFHGVGLEDIAEAAGVSRQAVYKSHFASKSAVDMIAAMLSVETYQHLVVERGWKPEAHIAKVWALCLGSVLVTPVRGAPPPKAARRKH